MQRHKPLNLTEQGSQHRRGNDRLNSLDSLRKFCVNLLDNQEFRCIHRFRENRLLSLAA